MVAPSVAGMSLGLEVLLVRLDELHDTVGSRNDQLFRALSAHFAHSWPHDDDYWVDEIADGAPTAAAAARAVIDGGPFDEQYGHLYRSAYQNVCEFVSDFHLSNDYFTGFRSGWLDEVDKGLQHVGITTASLDDLLYVGSPQLLPVSEGMQSGEWDLATCRAGLAEWQASTPEQRAELHPEVLRGVENCVEWMAEAVAISHQTPEEFGVAAFLI